VCAFVWDRVCDRVSVCVRVCVIAYACESFVYGLFLFCSYVSSVLVCVCVCVRGCLFAYVCMRV